MTSTVVSTSLSEGKGVPNTAVVTLTSYTYHLCTYVLDYVAASTKHWYICFEHSWQLYTNVWATPLLTYWQSNFGITFQTAINRTTSLTAPSAHIGAITDTPPGDTSPSCYFRLLELPDELLVAVLAKLPTNERARCALVCHRLASALSTPAAWRTISICTSRWSDLKEAKIDTWLARRAGPRSVHHLQLGSPQYRVRLHRPSLINQVHGVLGGLRKVDVQHVEPFDAARVLSSIPTLTHANLTGAACNDPALQDLTPASICARQLSSLTLHAPTHTCMPQWPMFVSVLQHLVRLSLGAPGAQWHVRDEHVSSLQRLTSLELHGMQRLVFPEALTALTRLQTLVLLRVGEVQGLAHVPGGLHVLHTHGVRWSQGLAALVGRLAQLRVLHVCASGRAEVLPQLLMQLPMLEVLRLQEDDVDGGGGVGQQHQHPGNAVAQLGDDAAAAAAGEHVLSLSLDTLAPLTALREVELTGSGRRLQVEGQQLAVLAGLPHLTRFEVRCSCVHSVHGSVDVMRALQEAFAQAKPAADVASLQFRSDSCASLSHLVADADLQDLLDG